MADLYLKALESERKQLWATCRLKGLPRDTKERQRIVELDEKITAHKAKIGVKPAGAKPKAAKRKPKVTVKPKAKPAGA